MMAETRAGHDPGGKWEVIGPLDCPVLYRRTLIAGRFGKLMLHRFVPSSSDKDCHDHPSSFLTIVLRGGYDDCSPCPTCLESDVKGWLLGDPSNDWRQARPMTLCPTCRGHGRIVDAVRAPTIRYRRAEHAHITKVGPAGAFTICIMGPKRRSWGFFRDGRWWPWRRYEEEFGLNFRCDDE